MVADVPANLLAPSELLQCNHSLDQVSCYNVAYLCAHKALKQITSRQPPPAANTNEALELNQNGLYRPIS